MAAIGSITIPDNTVWLDRYDWTGVHKAVTRTIGGGLVIQTTDKTGGRPVTLDLGWVAKSTLDDLAALRDDSETESFTVTLPDATTITCAFAPVEVPIRAEPLQSYTTHQDPDYFQVVVQLVEVA